MCIRDRAEGAREETPAERRVRHQGHAQLLGRGHHLRLDVPAEQRPLRLHGRDGMHGVRGAQFGGRDLAQAQMLDLALPHQLGHDGDGVLDGDVHITPVHVVEIDRLDVQTLQARLDCLPDVGRVIADDPSGRLVRRDRQGELGRDDDLVAVGPEERGQEEFVLAGAVGVRRVVEGDAQFQGPFQGGPGLLGVRGAVGEAHAHAAEALHPRLGACVAEACGRDPAVLGHRGLSDARACPASP